MEVEHYVNEFDNILEKLGTQQIEVAVAIMQEVAKDRRMQEIQRHGRANKSGPATQRQREYLESLGVVVPEGVTKRQASQMIDKVLDGAQQESGGPTCDKKTRMKVEAQEDKRKRH